MPSFYERITELEVLERKIAELNNKLYYAQSILQRKLQKDCQHEIVIHYGDDKLSAMYQQNYYLGNFYCPCCGQHSFRIESSDRIENSEDWNAFVLEASGYKSPIPQTNLKEVLKIYKELAKVICQKEEFRNQNLDTAKILVEAIKQLSGITFYKVKVTVW